MIALPAGKYTEMVGQYIMEKTGAELTPGMYEAFMIVNDDKDFVGGVVFSDFRKTNIQISCASETPQAFRHTVCNAIFQYVFVQLGCARCTSITRKSNKRARGFLEALGFQLEGNIRLGYEGRWDALVYGMLRSECRFLDGGSELDGGQEQSVEASSAGPGGDGGGTDASEYHVGDSASEPQPD